MDATSGLPRADYAAGLAARNCRTLLLTALVRPHNLANTPLYQTCSATLLTHEESKGTVQEEPLSRGCRRSHANRAHSFLMCLWIPRGNFRCWLVSPFENRPKEVGSLLLARRGSETDTNIAEKRLPFATRWPKNDISLQAKQVSGKAKRFAV